MTRVRGSFLAVGALVVLGIVAGPAVAADCPNAEIRAQQGVEGLPDCMALEMVSPPKKFVQLAEGANVSVDGSRVWFYSKGGLEGAPSMPDTFAGDPYVATRGVDGWVVSPASLPGELNRGWSSSADIVRSYSPDFSRWIGFAATRSQMELGEARVFRSGLGGVFTPLSPLLVPIDPANRFDVNVQYATFQGASADHSRIYFKPAFSFSFASVSYTDFGTTYLEDDPVPAGGEAHVYVAGLGGDGSPSVELLARDGEGKVWGERCGARVGGSSLVGGPLDGRDQGAVSSDGSRVLFSTRPGQTGPGVCDPVANRLRVMRRVETESGPWIAQLSASECDRVAPACDPVDGDDLYQGASVDGKRVYFTTNRQLADSDLDGAGSGACTNLVTTGCDLYMYDATRPAGGRLMQVSAGEANAAHPTVGSSAGVATGTVAISGDGTHVYFVADGVLTDAPNPEGAVAAAGQRNLFVWDADQETLAFVGALASSDNGLLWGAQSTFKNDAYPVPAVGTDGEGTEVGGDGHVLVFRTQASLTADDSDGGSADIYRYDADSDELQRISIAAAGGSDNGTFDVRPRTVLDGTRVGTDFAEYKRWVSEDSETIVFQTSEQLVADDTNALYDDYLWRDGEVYRLPGTSRTLATLVDAYTRTVRAPALSHDGSSVAFEAITPLLPEDGDAVADVYVARVDGGFEQPVVEDDCAVLADGCQDGGADTIAIDRRTAGPAGGGNAATGPRSEPMSVAIGRLSADARRSAGRSGVLRIRLRASRAGRLTVAVRARIGGHRKRVGQARANLQTAGTTAVSVQLSKAARRRLRHGSDLRIAIRVKPAVGKSKTLAALLPGASR